MSLLHMQLLEISQLQKMLNKYICEFYYVHYKKIWYLAHENWLKNARNFGSIFLDFSDALEMTTFVLNQLEKYSSCQGL